MSEMDVALRRFRGIVALLSASVDAPDSPGAHLLAMAGLDQAELLVQIAREDDAPRLLIEILQGISLLHMAGVMAAAGGRPGLNGRPTGTAADGPGSFRSN